MSEDRSEGPKISRRTALKIGAASGGALLVGKEVKTFKEGVVDTPGGVFYPLYGTHDIGVEAENIPEGLDAFFRELALEQSSFTDKPTDLFNNKFKDEKGQVHGIRNMEFPS